jgi:hypothetical protein
LAIVNTALRHYPVNRQAKLFTYLLCAERWDSFVTPAQIFL